MGPSPTYNLPEGKECETLVEYGLPLWEEPTVGYCSLQPRPSPMWGSRFMGAHAVGPRVGEQKILGKTPLRGNPSPEMTYLPSYPFFSIAQLRVPKWDDFNILRCSECARPRALKIFEVEFVTETKNPKEWRVWKYTACTRFGTHVVLSKEHGKCMTSGLPTFGETHIL